MMAALSFWAAGRRECLAFPTDAPPTQVDMPRSLLLDVVVNGNRIGFLGEFFERGGQIYAARKELEALGFKLAPASHGEEPATRVALSKLPGVTYRLEENTQTIYVAAPSAVLKPNELGPPQSELSALPVRSSTGAVINYDLAATYVDHRTIAEMVLDGRVFSPWGVLESSFTATNAVGLQAAPVVRLDTSITVSDTGALRQYRFGDFISSGLDWSRPVRMAGFQISSDFGIRPDLTTFPVPTITGDVAVPSSVDVLVNGVQELSQTTAAGPFEIRQLPVVTGVGDVSVVVRNAAGQETTQTLQLYSTRQLVAPGLDDYSVELGLLRLNYGIESDTYRAPAGSASFRHGLTSWLTLQGHVEASGGGGVYEGLKTQAGGMGGGGFVVALGRFGVVSGNVAGSRFGRRSGGLAAIGFERIAPHISFSAAVVATSGRFGDIASAYGEPVPSIQARAVLGLSWPEIGSFGVAFTEQRRSASLAQSSQAALGEAEAVQRDGLGFVPLALASKASVLSVSYSRPLFGDRMFVSATAFHDFAHSGSTGATFSLNIPFGRRSSASVEVDADPSGGDAAVELTQSTPDIGNFGYQLRAQGGDQSRELGIATYRSPWGVIDAGVDHAGGSTALRGDVQGAVAIAAGGVFPSLPITDSFAVVDTDGTPGVEVLQENRPVGRTDANGQLLVTDLRAFDANRLGVDPADIPIDAEAGPTTQLVRPRDRSGVVVHFRMKASNGAVVVLIGAARVPLPLGSRATLAGGVQDMVVGYGGEVFAIGLRPHNRIAALLPNGGRCAADFDFKRIPGRIPRIGPVFCRPVPM